MSLPTITFFDKNEFLLGLHVWNGIDEQGNDQGTVIDIGLVLFTISFMFK